MSTFPPKARPIRRFGEDTCRLDVRDVCRVVGPTGQAIAVWERSNHGTVELVFVLAIPHLLEVFFFSDSAEADFSQPVLLASSDCHFGGSRQWFVCPECSRRVAILYRLRSRFVCRHCGNFGYSSQSEASDDRALRRANSVRSRLGWPRGPARGKGERPKGMHQATFQRLVSSHDAHVDRSLTLLARKFGLDTLVDEIGINAEGFMPRAELATEDIPPNLPTISIDIPMDNEESGFQRFQFVPGSGWSDLDLGTAQSHDCSVIETVDGVLTCTGPRKKAVAATKNLG